MIKGLGIDLGTTYSCVAYIDENGKPVVLKNSEGKATTPSVVYFETKDKVIVGEIAKQSLVSEPDNTVAFIKRDMGKIDEDTKQPIMRTIQGIQMSPQEISAKILTKIVKDANAELRMIGKLSDSDPDVKDVVITCPAYFGMAEREATKVAGKIAGLNVVNIIPEPTAAALNYAYVSQVKQKTFMVYDLGGGTFDVTIIEMNNGIPRVICTDGSHTLGGKDWDEMLVQYFAEKYLEEKGEDVRENLDILQELFLKAEQTKITLSSRETAPVMIIGDAGRLNFTMTRTEFDEKTKELLERSLSYIDNCLKIAAAKKYKKEDETITNEEVNKYLSENISDILLVGGSSKMPQVSKLISERYGIEPKEADLDEAVAKGAAICASTEFTGFSEEDWQLVKESVGEHEFDVVKEAIQTGNENVIKQFEDVLPRHMVQKQESRGMIFTNVSPRTYGTSAYESSASDKLVIINFIKRNDELPKKLTQSFYTREEGQSGVNIDLYESFSMSAKTELEDGTKIGSGVLDFPHGMPKGTSIEVTINMNSAGLLEVSAFHKETNSVYNGTFDVSNSLSPEETKQAIERNKQQSFS